MGIEFFQEKLNEFHPNQNQYDIKINSNYYVINNEVFMPIKLSNHIDLDSDLLLKDDQGNSIGEIIYNDKLNFTEISSLPIKKFCCFLIENDTNIISDETYKFQYDFLIIKDNFLNEYLENYFKTSFLWGGFIHKENLLFTSFDKKIRLDEITLYKNKNISTDLIENVEQILLDTNPFTRFLKLYHLIELNFDMHTAELINKMFQVGGKEKEISDTLRDYSRNDIDRLKSLFNLNIDKQTLIKYLNVLKNFNNIASDIFYYTEKESNPLRSKDKFNKMLLLSTITEASFNQIWGSDMYNNKIIAATAYWIYRIRNCIAHNKLGEYVIKRSDEDFIVEFAEPLIRDIVKQCYKK